MKRATKILMAMGLAISLCLCSACGLNGLKGDKDLDGTRIHLVNDRIAVSGQGASVAGTVVTIEKSGTYYIEGTLKDGQILVKTEKKKKPVTLVLNGAVITNDDGPAILVEDTKNVTLLVQEGTENTVTSGTEGMEAVDEEAVKAAIFSNESLTIDGNGALTVNGYINNGISAKKTLSVKGGALKVMSVNNSLKGEEKAVICGGVLFVAGFDISHKVRGIVSDELVEIKGGSTTIALVHEGIQGKKVSVKGGALYVSSLDDGISAAGGDENSKSLPILEIGGGTVFVNSGGDGFDSNGDLFINGGTVIIEGASLPTDAALDYGAENGGGMFADGGTILALGAEGKDEPFNEKSKQYSFRLRTQQDPGSTIVIMTSDGRVLMEHTSEKAFSSLIFSSSELKKDEVVKVMINGQTETILLTEKSTS